MREYTDKLVCHGPKEAKDVRKQFQENYHSTLAVLMASVMSLKVFRTTPT